MEHDTRGRRFHFRSVATSIAILGNANTTLVSPPVFAQKFLLCELETAVGRLEQRLGISARITLPHSSSAGAFLLGGSVVGVLIAVEPSETRVTRREGRVEDQIPADPTVGLLHDLPIAALLHGRDAVHDPDPGGKRALDVLEGVGIDDISRIFIEGELALPDIPILGRAAPETAQVDIVGGRQSSVVGGVGSVEHDGHGVEAHLVVGGQCEFRRLVPAGGIEDAGRLDLISRTNENVVERVGRLILVGPNVARFEIDPGGGIVLGNECGVHFLPEQMGVVEDAHGAEGVGIVGRSLFAESARLGTGELQHVGRFAQVLGGDAGAGEFGVVERGGSDDAHGAIGLVVAAGFDGAGSGHEGALFVGLHYHVGRAEADLDDGVADDRLRAESGRVVNSDTVVGDGLRAVEEGSITIGVVHVDGHSLNAKLLPDRHAGVERQIPHRNAGRPASEAPDGRVAITRNFRQRRALQLVIDPGRTALHHEVMQMLGLTDQRLAVHDVHHVRQILREIEHEVHVRRRLSGNGIILDQEVERPPFLALVVARSAQGHAPCVLAGGNHHLLGIAARRPLVTLRQHVIGIPRVTRHEVPRVFRHPPHRFVLHGPHAARIAQLFSVRQAVAVRIGLAQLGGPSKAGVLPVLAEGREELRGGAGGSSVAGGVTDAAAVAVDAAGIDAVAAGDAFAVGEFGSEGGEGGGGRGEAEEDGAGGEEGGVEDQLHVFFCNDVFGLGL
mmetsp:Transcript_11258/g.23637  ORF Transcript_11258/g.23637 Transcript_11258/m.23637 type:complete len:729 (-) Transcript_11258:128-2314(-)